MKIKQREHRFVEINPNLDPKIKICLYCEKWNIHVKLTPRPNYEEIDKDMWLYCKNCHRAFLKRDTRTEGRLKSTVEAKDL